MRKAFFILLLGTTVGVDAQKLVRTVEKGNLEYRRQQFEKAGAEYTRALEMDKTSAVAHFNNGNAKQKLKKYAEASRAYEAAAAATTDPGLRARAFYNQGLSFIRQNQLPEAVDAFKRSLRLAPGDSDARENLQKALKEMQRQQSRQNEQQPDKNKKKNKDNKQSKPSGTRLSREEAEKMLNNLGKEEKNLQKEVQKKNQSARQLKDW